MCRLISIFYHIICRPYKIEINKTFHFQCVPVQVTGPAGASVQNLVGEENPFEPRKSTSLAAATQSANIRLWESQRAATWNLAPVSILPLPPSGDPGRNVRPLKLAAARARRRGAGALSAAWALPASERTWRWCRAATQSHAPVLWHQPSGRSGAPALWHVEGETSRGRERWSWEPDLPASSSARSKLSLATWTSVPSATFAPGGSFWAEMSLRKKKTLRNPAGVAIPTFLSCQQRLRNIWLEWGRNMWTCSSLLSHCAGLAFFSQAGRERWEHSLL